MALLPDLAMAALYGVVVFLLVLGFLVVFVEKISGRQFVAVLAGSIVLAAALLGLGEAGVSLLVVGAAAAFVANHAFEWLTTR